MSSILVTGGAGFIGSHLAHRLVTLGHDVRVIDNFLSGKRANLAPILDSIDLLEGDLRSPEDCASACRGVDAVLHLAARPSVPMSVEDPRLSHDINVNGTFNLLVAARDAGVRRVVYAASSSAYGESGLGVKTESQLPAPLSPYAANKLVGEYYMRVFYESYGLQTLSLRYFNVFGPRQDPKSQYAAAIPAFVTSILEGRAPTIYGDGEQTRDFTFIENVIHANLLAIEAEATHGEVLNIACGERISVNQVIADINAALGTSVAPNHVAERAGDIKHSLANIELAREVLGYAPSVDFQEGLRRTIAWYQDNA
ncbi:MAG: LPS biosynthesis protein WbpP [Myxococcales bacterium]|nr:LPS biosynthesis protein WbpP [Myxococcales bacterium]